MTRVIMLRHGQSTLNLERRSSGQIDAPLSSLGEKQAEYACRYLCENEKIDVIISSDLQRAVNTVRQTADFFGLPIIKDRELREIDSGDWAGRLITELNEKYRELREKTLDPDSDIPFPNGESYKMLDARIRRAVARIVAEHEGKTILLSVHQGAVRSVIKLAKEVGEYGGELPAIYNASIHILNYENGRWIPEALEIIPYPDEYFVRYSKL